MKKRIPHTKKARRIKIHEISMGWHFLNYRSNLQSFARQNGNPRKGANGEDCVGTSSGGRYGVTPKTRDPKSAFARCEAKPEQWKADFARPAEGRNGLSEMVEDH